MVIKRVNPMSAAKVGGILGVLLGLVIGAFASLGAMLWTSRLTAVDADMGGTHSGAPFLGMFFSAGAIIIVPICYGVLSFIMGAIYAALYNLAARWVGGIEIEAA